MDIDKEINLREGCILIVDDEKDIQELLMECLSSLTPNILIASNGEEALQTLMSNKINVILSDIKMPIKSGLQLLADVREMGILVPFVIVTAHADKQSLMEAIRLDATDFLDKPFHFGDVVKIMTRALQLGLMQARSDKHIEQVYNASNLSIDEIARAKKFRKVMARLRFQSQIFKTKVD